MDDNIVNHVFRCFYQIKIENLTFYRSLEDLSLLFLAPILAVGVWFILNQWETTSSNILTMAAISLMVGLMIDEIVLFLKEKTLGRFSGRSSSTDNAERVVKAEETQSQNSSEKSS